MCLPQPSRWEDACTAAAIVAVDPGIGGISLRAAAGPVRDRWLQQLSRLLPARAPLLRIPLNVSDGRLHGELDLAATLVAGRPVAERGLLAAADGGVMLLAMAERLSTAAAAKICTPLDTRVFQYAVVALDEGIDPEERPPALLLERLALHVDLNGIPVSCTDFSRPSLERAPESVTIDDEWVVALCEAAEALGIDSARTCLQAVRVARAVAALAGRTAVAEEDAASAARLVFAPRARKAPAAQTESSADTPTREPEQQAEPKPQADRKQQAEQSAQTDQPPAQALADRILHATRASLPPTLNFQAATTQSRRSGRSRGESDSRQHGRPAGTRVGDPRGGARLSVIETLRAAAPWQRIRRRKKPGAQRILIRKNDFRITRCKRRNQLTTIFVVDASGSAAFNRLAEVKGAVELMLAESYIRRDRVALIAFRGKGAQMLLPPTHSLARVKRELASLPGGGGTPTALGLDTARGLADTLLRHGEAPVVVVLTDGGPNVTRDGKGNRARAEADTMNAARLMKSNSIAAVMVDTAPQPRRMTEQLAKEMGATYVPLPHANAGELAHMVQHCRAGIHV